MNKIKKQPLRELGYHFIPKAFLPPDGDEYTLRDRQRRSDLVYRKLKAEEIEILVRNENRADSWDCIYVTDRFNPDLVKRCQFFGLIRIGNLEDYFLEFHDLRLPVGLYNSTIVSCDIGSNVSIDNVNYLAHTIIGDEVILINIEEMLTTDYAKFGNGIIKQGEPESVRIWLALGNENEGRRVAPFDGMLPGDAWLWAKYRDRADLMQRFLEMTNERCDPQRGYYGTIGDRTIIKDCRILKDIQVGTDAYIKGANKLKNLTIHSDAEESSQIGEGVELVNGIIGYGCRIFYGVKAVRFIMGPNSNLKYGARLINSFLGDNSTISCCEVLNSLIFPGHEQHHNNSFLCAGILLGQTNMAAGVSAGSNHNSRANDGEIVAGRGFWPGLCTSLKHNCKFASFTLLAKGSYPAELNIPLPFALVSNDETHGELRVMPAYWFMYNMYAVTRNAWKYTARDKRVHKHQMIEFDTLAPDTVEEMFHAMSLLELWTAEAHRLADEQPFDTLSEADLRRIGHDLMMNQPEHIDYLDIFGRDMENSGRPVRILKAAKAYEAYRRMIHFYAVRTLVETLLENNMNSLIRLKQYLGNSVRSAWTNVGGQLMPQDDLNVILDRVVSGEIDSWDRLHEEYQRQWELYPIQKARHAMACLLEINGLGIDDLSEDRWYGELDRASETAQAIAESTYQSRAKDYTGEFRKITFANEQEMTAVFGELDKNDFIQRMREQTEQFQQDVQHLKRR